MWQAPRSDSAGRRTSGTFVWAVNEALAYAASLAFALSVALGSGALPAAHAGAGAGGADDAASAASAAGREQAHWVKKKINFTYQGFTTHYSCQGLRDKVREVLLELGARKSGLDVHEIGCTTNIGEPNPFPSVGGTFYVLEPGSSSNGQAVKAEWQNVDVRVGSPGLDTAGQCELIEQVKQKILPLFATRDVRFKQDCIPYQLTPNGSSLSVEVLKPAQPVSSAPQE